MKANYPIEKFQNIETPFYYYDLNVLRATLAEINQQIAGLPYVVHYAVKANANNVILGEINKAGLGADCVSGGEVQAAIDAGIPASKVVFAGVGKADWEIKLGLENDIFCFNVESIPELEIIDSLAKSMGKTANIALRLNPNVQAHTHKHITTGTNENKFGINLSELDKVTDVLLSMKNCNFYGIHFHIGSQITDLSDFRELAVKTNEIQEYFDNKKITLKHINVGGGLGVNYEHPNHFPIPDFEGYFRVWRKYMNLREGQIPHFELGRSIVAQCGSLVSRVLYVKEGQVKKFAILDAGFTDLIRPALYQAYHRIENLSSNLPEEVYDVVGPICESSDTFAKDYTMNAAQRGDVIVLRTAGAYGEIMASQYNLRKLPKAYYSPDFK
jgi:diaminopimelate decarboxylase